MKTFLTDVEKQQMRELVEPLDSLDRRQRYLAGNFPRADRVKDLDRRYRWDLFWVACTGNEFVSAIYDRGGNDNHIDTALRQIVKPLKENT